MNRSQKTLSLLRDYESPNILAIAPDLSAPMVWERAKGVRIWDAAGRLYLDLTAAFGVAAAGHANPRVVAAGRRQMGTLLHAMGDVYPHARKAELARELSRRTFERWTAGSKGKTAHTGKTIFTNSGFEAVEAALKTALLATGSARVLAFTGAYHGLGYGALNATHRHHFRGPFLPQLGRFASFAQFPKTASNGRRQKYTRQKNSARYWSNPCRDAGVARFRRLVFCRGCADGATTTKFCLYLTRFTRASAARESGLPASIAPRSPI
jgi:4-aminobutyrate aminotransferase-like enzyme